MKLSTFLLGALACAVSGSYAGSLGPNAPYCALGATCENTPQDCSDLGATGTEFTSTPIYNDAGEVCYQCCKG
ncbi:hypothetical protein N7519_007002 [Penicillium mononematosum]|uniref:uncharacterized protein n=1 Tax=Penicillium mononematosum TaxID=268346 RepID=UPI0025467FA6|nr:uncharacterized protein N7519_007002 [Penicillium mononematosum]KAJ6185701.1 hypothetical protein N7519_007002 [Penicillium mononematosum]